MKKYKNMQDEQAKPPYQPTQYQQPQYPQPKYQYNWYPQQRNTLRKGRVETLEVKEENKEEDLGEEEAK